MALPTASDLTSATTTNAQMKTYLQGMRDFIANLLGTTETTAAARTALGAGTVGNTVFQASTAAAALAVLPIQTQAAQSAVAGTALDFTSIPSWVKRITLSFANLSTTGGSLPIVQLGDSGGIETTGYLSYITAAVSTATVTTGSSTTGILLQSTWSSTAPVHGAVVLTLIDAATNLWAATVCGGSTAGGSHGFNGGGSKSTSATLDRIRLTTTGGTDTFDAGTVNILYE